MKELTEYGNYEIDGSLYTKRDIFNLYRLQKQLLIEENIVATIEDCANIWQHYSNDLEASWLFFPEADEDILNDVKSSDFFTNFTDYAQ